MSSTLNAQLVDELVSDMISFANFMYKPAGFKVARRLAPPVDTMQFYIDRFDGINSTYTQSVNTVNNAVSQAQQSVIAADALITTNASAAAQAVAVAIDGVAIDANLVNDALMTTVPPVGTEGEPRTQRDKNAENLSELDFFTRSERVEYENNKEIFDAKRPLQEFFNYISANDVGTAKCDGVFYTSQGLTLGGITGSLTKNIVGSFNLRALPGSNIYTLFGIQAGQNLNWQGLITVGGLGGIVYPNRLVRRGLVIGGIYRSTHTYISAVMVENGFSEYGVLMDNNTTGSCIDSIRGSRCGSGLYDPNNSGGKNWSIWSDFTIETEVVTGGITQSSTLKVTKLPLENLTYPPMVRIGNELYNVNSVDYEKSEITIFPLLDRTNTETELRYYFGAVFATAGSDASVVRVNKLSTSDCGVGYHSGSLYPATVGTFTAEKTGIDLVLGGATQSQALVGGYIAAYHYESADYAIVRRTRAPLSMVIGSTNYELALNKIKDLTPPRIPSTNMLNIGSALEGLTLGYSTGSLIYENARELGNVTRNIDVTDIIRTEFLFRGNSQTFNIVAPNKDINLLTGYNRKSCAVIGTNKDTGAPTGAITFVAPVGYTVNNLAEVVFKDFSSVAKFDVHLDFLSSNFTVTCLTKSPLQTRVIHKLPSLEPSTQQSLLVPLVGAKLGDFVSVSIDKLLKGSMLWGEVSAADQVTVYHVNNTLNAVDIPNANIYVKLS